MISTAIVAVACAALPTAWYLFPAFRSQTGSGGKDVPITILAVDSAGGAPVAGAEVRVRHPFRPDLIPDRRGRTGPDGRAVLTLVAQSSMKSISAEAEGVYRVVFWKSETISTTLGLVTVEAPGFRVARVPLDGPPGRSPIVVRLRPKPPTPGR